MEIVKRVVYESEVAEIVQEQVKEVGRIPAYLEQQLPTLLAYGMKVVLAFFAFVVGHFLIGWTRKLVKKSLTRTEVDQGVIQFLDSFLKFALHILLIFGIVTKLGVDTASVAALLASTGVAVGMALQGSLSNFAGGFLILVLKPFQVGDYIVEDTNKNEGVVTEIQVFYTKLLTLENKTIVLPNGMLSNNSVTNVTAMSERQLDIKVPITPDSDLRLAKQLMEEIVSKDSSLLQEREVAVFVDSLGERGVVLGLRAWAKGTEYWKMRWRIQEEIKLAFDEHGIQIPLAIKR